MVRRKRTKTLLEISAKADIVLPGLSEGVFMFGESDPDKIGELFLLNRASIVVIKLGKEGAIYFKGSKSKRIPGFPIERVIDPGGAGDGFAAGLLSGLLDDLDLTQAVQRANAVGALVTMVSGDVEGLPEKNEIERLIQQKDEDVIR